MICCRKLIDDDEITEIMVNGTEAIFIEKAGEMKKWKYHFTSKNHLEDLIQQIAGRCNRIVNEANPVADARLENGDRVSIVLPPAAVDGDFNNQAFPKTTDFNERTDCLEQHYTGSGRLFKKAGRIRIQHFYQRGNRIGKDDIFECFV